MLSEGQLLALHVLASGVADVAFSLSLGALAAFIWKTLPATYGRKLFVLIGLAALLIAAAQPVQLVILTAGMTGAASFSELVPQFRDVLSTHAGWILLPQAIAAGVAAAAALIPFPRRSRLALVAASLFVLSLFRSASGHAASDGNYSLRELSQWIHLVATGVWAGGVMLSAWLLSSFADTEQQYANGNRLSMQSATAIVFIFMSGIWNTWLGVGGDIQGTLHTRWVLLLAIKLLFVLTALALGATNRRTLQHPPTKQTMHRLCVTLRVEAVLMLVILLLSAWLGSVAPAA
ncbi:copper resistance D family protein [Terriglobus albidus]|uniref:copper resistance D family protein n=1 Tax=Terriglobus albidus TaxID=1592106 RepID=UPI0021DFAB40|nr:CopD family protein [Terriglobus albidus]